jgi:hypothetical protein
MGADPDDKQSMIRLLVSANEFNIEGLIVSTSCWRKSQSNINILTPIVDAYGKVVSNLQKHANGFPSLEYLRSISCLGRKGYGMNDVGSGKDSKGSDLIIAAVDKSNDPRPIWVLGWGGMNNLAQALWKVKNDRSADEIAKFIRKVRAFDILGQDNAGTWIAKTFPELIYVRATKVYQGWQPSNDWLRSNIQNHGPMGAQYPNTIYETEGDSPSYMHLFSNGVNDPDKLGQGGWGGRFEKKTGIRGMSCMNGEDAAYDPYTMYGNTPEENPIKRWEKGYNSDFAVRMDWTQTSDYNAVNHHPFVVVNGDPTRNIIEMNVSPGENATLSTQRTSDPDGNTLSYSWSFYKEPSTYKGAITIQNNSSQIATVSVPSDAAGKNIHLILEVRDNGSPNLYVYRRMILNSK